MKWIEIKLKNPRCENASRLEPMPPGPYLICSQHDMSIFEGMEIERVRAEFKNKLVTEIPEHMWGNVAYYFDDNGIAVRCYQHFDTSD